MYRSFMKVVFRDFENHAGEKEKWLRRFQKTGYYLIDSTDRPSNRMSEAERREELAMVLERIVSGISSLVTTTTPIILIKKNIFEIFRQPLLAAGCNVLHDSFLPFPSHGHQQRFIKECGEWLRAAHWEGEPLCPTTESPRDSSKGADGLNGTCDSKRYVLLS